MSALILLLVFFESPKAMAEPWISNRYAQNCAACHSPSRRNKPSKGRRCTLSCQGCHTNPAGGGLRNFYGQWNQDRWLRSFKSNLLNEEHMPAPLKRQRYAKHPKKGLSDKQINKIARKLPFDLATKKGTDYKLRSYDRSDKQEHITVRNETDFRFRVAKNDPYYLIRKNQINIGGDLRYFHIENKGEDVAESRKKLTFPMAFDFGLALRPFKTHKLSIVVETRYLNGPTAKDPESVFFSSVRPRSVYVMADDLAYNTYLQYGYLRPQFGLMTPDHESLAQVIAGFSQRSLYKTVAIGGSPNVPFANIYHIMPMSDSNSFSSALTGGQDEGYVANVGARFVTLGASVLFSYWSTKTLSSGVKRQNDMMSLSGGLTWQDFIINAEVLNIDKERLSSLGKDKGSVTTLDVKYRVWREIYLTGGYAYSNIGQSRGPGKASESSYGLRSYLVSGAKLDIHFVNRSNTEESTTSTTTKSDLIQVQGHIYF